MRVVFRTYTKKDGSPENGVAAILQHLADHNEKNVVVRLDIDKKNVYGYDEEDFFFPSLKITKLEIKPIDERKFEATFNTKDLRAMFVLLLKLGAIGNCGHSYELLIGDKSFYFDGDGADYVESINGVKLSSKIYDDKYKWPKIYNEDMKKNVVKINENTLKQIVAESVKKVLKEYHPDKVWRDTQAELFRKKQIEQDEMEISDCMSEIKPIFDKLEDKYGDLAYTAIMRLAAEMNPNPEY